MNALALDERGVPIGVMEQQWWLRPDECTSANAQSRPAEDRESWSWVRALRAIKARFDRFAPTSHPWFVMDRGADHGSTLVELSEYANALFTIRARHNRVLEHRYGQSRAFSTLARQPAIGTLALHVPRTPKRLERMATLEVRVLSRTQIFVNHTTALEVNYVRVREVSAVPPGESPIEWKLITNAPVETLAQALEVVRSYTCRWRIEEFHKTWKSGACCAEDSQLRSFEATRRWATILAAVAARIERLKHLSRQTPDVAALTEFTQDEIDAAIYVSKTKQWKPGATMTLAQAVRLVAQVGGYLGRKRDGPPGSITLRRGLERILPLANALPTIRRSD